MAEMKVNLTVVEGPEKGKSFSFHEPENFLLGRNAEGSTGSFPLVGNPSVKRLRTSRDSRNNIRVGNVNEIFDSFCSRGKQQRWQ